MTGRTKVAIIGSGNIGTDLMFKVMRLSESLEVAAMVGIDAASDGLARAKRLGIPITTDGVDGLLAMPDFGDIGIVFDATSAGAHLKNDAALQLSDVKVIDLTPAAIGPFVVPAVNLDVVAGGRNVNMVTCGGQATIPIVAAIARTSPVPYAEIVASIASLSAGPGTRANIDEFTETTAHAIEQVGGATRGKAIIVLNPADPPLIMRDTVLVLTEATDPQLIIESIEAMVADVAKYVPGYRLRQRVQIETVAPNDPRRRLVGPESAGNDLLQVNTYLEVEGAAHYLPSYAGNLDIMTSAALRVAEVQAGGSK